jgi:hypothetical protein
MQVLTSFTCVAFVLPVSCATPGRPDRVLPGKSWAISPDPPFKGRRHPRDQPAPLRPSAGCHRYQRASEQKVAYRMSLFVAHLSWVWSPHMGKRDRKPPCRRTTQAPRILVLECALCQGFDEIGSLWPIAPPVRTLRLRRQPGATKRPAPRSMSPSPAYRRP